MKNKCFFVVVCMYCMCMYILDCVNKIQNVKIIHSAALISLIFTGKNVASGNSDWLVTLESYQPNWLVIKKVNLEP